MANEKVRVEISADGSKVTPAVDKAKKELSTLGSTAQSISKEFSSLGAALAGAFSVGAFTSFLVKVNGIADGLNDLAQRMGASASGLQSLQLAAQLAGGSAEGMTTALNKMTATLGDAMAGNDKAVQAFTRLGLSISELSKLKADEAFRQINQALSEIPNTFERASAAQDIFGKGAKDIAGLLADGNKAINEVNESLARQGAALNDLDIAKIGVMNDQLQFQETVVTNLGTKFLSGLAPAIGVATSTLADMLSKMGGATDAGQTFGVVMTFAIKSIESAAYGLAAVFETVRELIANVLSVITGAVSDIISAFGYLADVAGLDSMAASLRRGSEVIGGISESLQDISVQASKNADFASAQMLRAANDALNASEIYNQAQANFQKTAAEAAARNAANQGAGSGYQAPGRAGDKTGKTFDLGTAQDAALAGLSTAANAQFAKTFDPAGDIEAITADARYKYLQDLYDQHSQTMAGKLDAFNQTWLGQLLNANEQAIAADQYKNMTLGEGVSQLVSIAAQQSGALGKVGKAFAIAQTVWSTSTAIMNAMAQVPYPANIGVAAAIAAKGVMQLANIKKTNIGSGGSVAGVGGGIGTGTSPFPLSQTPAGTQAAAQEQPSAVQIIVQGNVFSSTETANWLAEQIAEKVNNQDFVFINGNSRQAMELAPA